MTYLSRELIRRMIIAEARKKAPLLPGGGVDFSDRTEDLTDLDLSRIEDTETVDIDKDTKIDTIPPDLSSLYDDEEDFGFVDGTEQGFSPYGLDDFEEEPSESDTVNVPELRGDGKERASEEQPSEEETVENPLPKAAYDERFRLQPNMKSSVDPFGRTIGQIKQDVFKTYDDLYEPPTKKSESAEEEEFLRKMQDMIAAGAAAADFPDDPEFAPEDTAELPDDTLELPMDRFNKDNSDDGDDSLEETISRLIRESISKKVKLISKNNRY